MFPRHGSAVGILLLLLLLSTPWHTSAAGPSRRAVRVAGHAVNGSKISAAASHCPSQRFFKEQVLAAARAGTKQGLAGALRAWRPAVLGGFVTHGAAEALAKELLGEAASWKRTLLQPAEDPRLVATREDMLAGVAAAADAALSTSESTAARNASCIGRPQSGRPRKPHWDQGGYLFADAVASDRVMLEKPEGWTIGQLERGFAHSKTLAPKLNPDYSKFRSLGPAPGLPCLAQLTRALVAPEVAEQLTALLGLRGISLEPFIMRIYQHSRPYHFTGPHTDEMYSKILGSGYIQSLISVNINLGGDEVPGRGNGGLVWCSPRPRWLPSPLGSATIFRISNHSWHAVLPGQRAPTGRRLTIQVVYGVQMLQGSTARPPGYDDSAPVREDEDFFAGPSAEEGPAAERGEAVPGWEEDAGCADGDPSTYKAEECRLRALTDSSVDSGVGFHGCKPTEPLEGSCCKSCQELWRNRDHMLERLGPRRGMVSNFLQTVGTRRFRSVPLRGSAVGASMPLLALGTGGMRGKRARKVISFALRSGFRHLDSAVTYPSFPDDLEQGISLSGVPRGEVFITTKVPTDAMGFQATSALTRRLAQELPGGYADLCMVHWPQAAAPLGQAPEGRRHAAWSIVERAGTWRALEAAFDARICRALGVSNYLVKHLEELESYARVPTAVNQIEYSPTAPLLEVITYCRERGIVVEAFAWNRPQVLEQPELVALAQQLWPGRALDQGLLMKVLMRWFMAQGMVPLFRSEREERLLEVAEGLMERVELTEAQIASLVIPRGDYPWKYYAGDMPWKTAVMDSLA